jgi:CHAD domain-containing protein
VPARSSSKLPGFYIMAFDSDRVRKPIRKLRKLLRKLPKQPTPDEVHNLRTNTRRLEAILCALSLDSHRNDRRLLKNLAQVRKRAGKVRDMDVLTGFADGVHVNGEQDCKVKLLEHLGAKRRKGAKKLHVVVTKQGSTARSRLKRTLAELENALDQSARDGSRAGNATARAAAFALRLESQLAHPSRLSRKNLHPYRLGVKELQNVLRLGEHSSNEEFVNALGQVKDAIGEWHDWEELLAITKGVLDHGTKCTLLRRLKEISDEKYRDALSKAENMRRLYLPIPQGKSARGGMLATKPVWAATQDLAA